ncbi:hypothetical protein EQG49_06385 [Periweissella cryptocerci]|uniref:Uncharacterized protein n=1 Tax=Periweissella cryptocerci TaxID=2506420 RepID=A0A4P6YTT1_9LACO|nr:hypothetical protein [Periweissella cryptocerci]QBO36110.1 hypothetical protein EQG49_06385 [Periweissella cryptocerci]
MFIKILKKLASFSGGSGGGVNDNEEQASDIEKMTKIVALLKELEKAVRQRKKYFQEQDKIERGLINTTMLIGSLMVGLFTVVIMYLAAAGSGDNFNLTSEMEFLTVIMLSVTAAAFLLLRYIFKNVLIFLAHNVLDGKYHNRVNEILKVQAKIIKYLKDIEVEGTDIPRDVLSPNLCSQILVYLRRQQVFDIEGGIEMMRMDNSLSTVYKTEKISLFQREEIFMRTLDFEHTEEKNQGNRIISLLSRS